MHLIVSHNGSLQRHLAGARAKRTRRRGSAAQNPQQISADASRNRVSSAGSRSTIVCWDRLAEATAESVKKGDPLYVEGRLQYRSYQDEEGKERGTCEVVADDVQFLGRRRTGGEEPPPEA